MASSSSAPSSTKSACKHLILDAGPILSLSPLRGLAETYYTVPQVLSELKDKRAREHFEKLGLAAGVSVKVASPDATSLAYVIQFAKKTGDYSVLSTADLEILALTYALDKKEKEEAEKLSAENQKNPALDSEPSAVDDSHPLDSLNIEAEVNPQSEAEEPPASEPPSDLDEDTEQGDESEREPLDVEVKRVGKDASPEDTETPAQTRNQEDDTPIYDDPSDEDDGEGEWITPSNVTLHKSRAMNLLPEKDAKNGRKGGEKEQIAAGCMTADFAMQNVLLQMGLNLVGVEGKRIEKVKTWVLRCHACFKICKDSSRKFCPSCGNPTLLRASVTLSSPTSTSTTPTLTVHLKKNFQFKTRGTIYSIPAPKAGSAKTGPGEGLILREDQVAWQRAKKMADGKRDREEKRLMSATVKSGEGGKMMGVVGSWMDPDWVPEIVSAGTGGKGRTVKGRGMDGDMPTIGYGRKNPNERRRRK